MLDELLKALGGLGLQGGADGNPAGGANAAFGGDPPAAEPFSNMQGMLGNSAIGGAMGMGGGGLGGLFSSTEDTKWNVVPLSDTDAGQLHIGENGRAFYQPEEDDNRPRIESRTKKDSGGSSASYEDAAKPKAKSKPKEAAPKPMTPEEMMKLADAIQASMTKDHQARMAEGPAARRLAGGSPENDYNTELTSGAEKAYRGKFGDNADQDYDLRGAFAAGLTDRQPVMRNDQGGSYFPNHLPDTFKKPNHETFSDESQYAMYAPDQAGSWDGDRFIPPGVQSSSEDQKEDTQWLGGPPPKQDSYGTIRSKYGEETHATQSSLSGSNEMTPERRDYISGLQKSANVNTGDWREKQAQNDYFQQQDDYNAWTRNEEQLRNDRDAAEANARTARAISDHMANLNKPFQVQIGQSNQPAQTEKPTLSSDTGTSTASNMNPLALKASNMPSVATGGTTRTTANPYRVSNNYDLGNMATRTVAKPSVGPVAMSDERQKKEKKPANELDEFMDALKAYSYNYKNPDAPGQSDGRKVGVMAQDLEKSEIGKQAVIETPHGKMVDFGKLAPVTLAGLVVERKSNQDQDLRLDHLEKLLAKLTK